MSTEYLHSKYANSVVLCSLLLQQRQWQPCLQFLGYKWRWVICVQHSGVFILHSVAVTIFYRLLKCSCIKVVFVLRFKMAAFHIGAFLFVCKRLSPDLLTAFACIHSCFRWYLVIKWKPKNSWGWIYSSVLLWFNNIANLLTGQLSTFSEYCCFVGDYAILVRYWMLQYIGKYF